MGVGGRRRRRSKCKCNFSVDTRVLPLVNMSGRFSSHLTFSRCQAESMWQSGQAGGSCLESVTSTVGTPLNRRQVALLTHSQPWPARPQPLASVCFPHQFRHRHRQHPRYQSCFSHHLKAVFVSEESIKEAGSSEGQTTRNNAWKGISGIRNKAIRAMCISGLPVIVRGENAVCSQSYLTGSKKG